MKHNTLSRILAVILLSSISVLAGAQHRNQNDAELLARDFFNQFPATKATSNTLTLVWKAPDFYVFNRGENEGFVIISDENADQPVLAYASEGEFRAKDMPANVKAWMQVLNSQSLHHKTTKTDLRMTGEKDLNTPDWNQDAPYNNKCPELVEGWRAYTGCAITATAIVMGYHKWPDKGTGTIPKYRVKGQQLGPYVLGETYDWNNMDDVATIMVQLGCMARAAYDFEGTSARLETITKELPKYMKYNPRMTFKERNKYSKEEWDQLLKSEIDAGRPIVYEGYDETSGHAFVIDGYNDQGMFNINWGWGGYCNGFYDLDRMNPSGSGIGGNASGGYSLSQGGIFGMRPRLAGDATVDAVEFIASQSFANGITTPGLELPAKKGDTFTVDAGIVKNFGTVAISGDFKLVMTDADGKIIEEFLTVPAEPLLPSETTLVVDRKIITITQDVLPGYRLRLVYPSANTDQWIPITCEPSIGPWEIVLNDSIPEPMISIEEGSSLQYDKKSGTITIHTLEGVTAELKEQSSQKDRSSLLHQEGSSFTIIRSDAGKGEFILTLQRGKEKKVIIFEL